MAVLATEEHEVFLFIATGQNPVGSIAKSLRGIYMPKPSQCVQG